MFYLKRLRLISSLFLLFIPVFNLYAADSYMELQWDDLLTQQDIKALMEPPEDIFDIEDGSVEDKIASDLVNKLELANDSDYQRALTSTVVREEYNQKKVRIPGFIVPITLDDNQSITTFFLVPYYGACIHMPPPPPNQIIYATFNKGFKLADMNAPYWLEGTLSTTLTENELAKSAYSISVDQLEIYN
jgi:hypothetical protein